MRFLADKKIKLILFFNNCINNIVDKLNLFKKFNNYILILESVIKYMGIAIKIEDKNHKCIIQDDLFKKQFRVENNSLVFIDNEIYQYKNYSFKFFNIFLLVNITNQMELENNKETFLATIVHDLKSPVLACEKAIYLLNEERFGGLNSSQHEILDMCHRSLIFSKYLIGNILCNYRHTQQYFGLCVEEFNIVELIKESVMDLEIFAKEKNINIILNIPLKFLVSADKNEIKRVVMNLVYNAISYSVSGSDIDIVMTYDEDNVSFVVKNKGEYIPPEHIKEIFKKNISLKNKYSRLGTGLGLYLSKEIILAHDGEMIAKSSPDNQNIFGFKLPFNNGLQQLQKY